jgi:hypothetical protein
MSKSTDLVAVSPSGGPPGVTGGCAVSVGPSTVRRSKPGETGVPGTVITSIREPRALKTRLSPVNGSTGAPNPVIAV